MSNLISIDEINKLGDGREALIFLGQKLQEFDTIKETISARLYDTTPNNYHGSVHQSYDSLKELIDDLEHTAEQIRSLGSI